MTTTTADTPSHTIDTYIEQRRAFQLHAATFAGSMLIIFVVNLILNLAAGTTGELWAWWSGWALLGWSLGIAVHGFVLLLARSETAADRS